MKRQQQNLSETQRFIMAANQMGAEVEEKRLSFDTAGGEKWKSRDGFSGQMWQLSPSLDGMSRELSGKFGRFVLKAKNRTSVCLSECLCNEVGTCRGVTLLVVVDIAVFKVINAISTPYIDADICLNTLWLIKC